MPPSPYQNQPESNWLNITRQLVKTYPFSPDLLVQEALESWDSIFRSRIGHEGFIIGKDIFPSPQIMGFFLHELIPLRLSQKYPKIWKKDREVSEKDLVYIPDLKFSLEIKTSSHKDKIFGNRSYGQPSSNPKKDKSGYYLAINFDGFSKSQEPKVKLIRFGWLDHSDWIAQKAATGQQARLTTDAEKYKLIIVYPTNSQNQKVFSDH